MKLHPIQNGSNTDNFNFFALNCKWQITVKYANSAKRELPEISRMQGRHYVSWQSDPSTVFLDHGYSVKPITNNVLCLN